MNIIIVGYGRVGASLAALVGSSHNVSVVDNDPAVIAQVNDDFVGKAVLGLGYDEKALREAGIEDADVVAAVTSSDNVNLMTSEVARRLFDVPRVVTRLVSLNRLDIYRQLGLDYVCDTEIVAEAIAAKIRTHHAHHVDSFGPYEILNFVFSAAQAEELGAAVDGSMTVDQFEERADVSVLLVQHDGEVTRPGGMAVLAEGDTVMALVRESAFDAIAPFMKD